MAYIDGPKYAGALKFDLTPEKDDLYDIAPGGLAGARGAGPEIDSVLAELDTAIKNHGDEAEIHSAVYARVKNATAKIAALNAKEIAFEKVLEVIRESRTRLENNREEDISAIAGQAETKAEKTKNPALLSHFEAAIRYRSRVADRASATRRKNEEAKKAEETNKKPPTP